MSKTIYCVGKINKNEKSIDLAVSNTCTSENSIISKRVNIVSIKMVKEGSVLYKNRKVSSPYDAFELIKGFLKDADREKLVVCCLDTKNQPTAINVASIGSLNSSIVHPREIFKAAVLSNSSSIIIGHNHPSGDPTPSKEDINITQRLKECGKILGIELIDHIIICDDEYLSLKDKDLI